MTPLIFDTEPFAPRSAAMVRRCGPRAVSTAGLLLVATGLAAWTWITADTPIWLVGAAFFLMGAGMANVMPPSPSKRWRRKPRRQGDHLSPLAQQGGPADRRGGRHEGRPAPAGRRVRPRRPHHAGRGQPHGRARRYGAATACLLPELLRDDDLRGMYQKIVEPRRDVMRQVLRRGMANGELRPDLDVELTLLMISGRPCCRTC